MEFYEGKYWELVSKHLSDDISAEEKTELFQWLEEDPNRRILLKDLEKVWERSEAYETPVFDSHSAWEKMQAKIAVPEKPVYPWQHRKPLLAAASVALLILAASLFYFFLKPGYSEVYVSTRPGETKEVFLPDGSRVFLNENSSLTYDRLLSENPERRVRMAGEAFFEVAENRQKPFIVGVNETETRVLGTSFNVHSDAVRENVKISLLSGKVQFSVASSKKDPIVLSPGYEIIYNERDESLTRQRYENANFLFWKNQRLVFSDERLADVLAAIGKYYHVSFDVKDVQLNEQRVTSTFDHQSLDEILDVLENLLDIRIGKSGNNYVVKTN